MASLGAQFFLSSKPGCFRSLRDAPNFSQSGPSSQLIQVQYWVYTGHDLDAFFLHVFREHQDPLLPECECILYNTFYALENDILDVMAGDMNSHIYAVGPLVFDSPATSSDGVEELSLAGAGSASSLWEEDPTSLAWLDHQTPNSVLFVSFGSITTVSMQQMQEFASGLELSEHAFLWVIRPDLIETICADNGYQVMFSDFVERRRDHALLVPWAPQAAVLSHPSVAAFLTHCGWNSTIESISSGVRRSHGRDLLIRIPTAIASRMFGKSVWNFRAMQTPTELLSSPRRKSPKR